MWELRAYPGAGPGGPRLLLVPAPIKRAYLWDLAPEVSVVRRALAGGVRVYLLRWTDPRPEHRDLGLDAYAHDALAEAIAAVEADAGAAGVALAGHSLGGTLAAIFAALRPEPVRGLVLLEAPLCFGRGGVGALGPLLPLAPLAPAIARALGNVPGSLLGLAAVAAAPDEFLGYRWADRLASAGDADAFRLHCRVERWTLDECAVPGRLFAEVVQRLYCEDAFMRGTLEVGGRRAGPATLTAPVLAVIDPASRLVPPLGVLPFLAAAASAEKATLYYEGDRGTTLRHVGVLVGRRAHERLWPRIFDWIAARG